ncbi:hypothetical protein M5K25_017835 [Dendrobium thyrsiflorum]|uniref:Reverse transcriptase zinc-binding domain-containing protein n=1 Tax=Dendrobium thyrsiflorum TaxID=117978 RepID=A0ABD0UHD3_DENTH
MGEKELRVWTRLCEARVYALLMNIEGSKGGRSDCVLGDGDDRQWRSQLVLVGVGYSSTYERSTIFNGVGFKARKPHYSCYTWLALNGGLKTADELIKRNIGVNSLCSLCFTFNETAPHLLFECDYAFAILKTLIPSLGDFLLRPRLTDIFLFLEGRSYHSKHQKIIHLLKAGFFWVSKLLCGILCWLGRSAPAPVGLPYPWMVFYGNRGWKWADMDDDVATFSLSPLHLLFHSSPDLLDCNSICFWSVLVSFFWFLFGL